jgi:hypothetical protein
VKIFPGRTDLQIRNRWNSIKRREDLKRKSELPVKCVMKDDATQSAPKLQRILSEPKPQLPLSKPEFVPVSLPLVKLEPHHIKLGVVHQPLAPQIQQTCTSGWDENSVMFSQLAPQSQQTHTSGWDENSVGFVSPAVYWIGGILSAVLVQ